MEADRYFGAEQRHRLGELMARWRQARDAGGALPPAEQEQLEELIAAELRGSAARGGACALE